LKNVSALPYSIKVLLENLIRHEDDKTVLKSDILEFQKWKKQKKITKEI
jgi:aconitate hydratase